MKHCYAKIGLLLLALLFVVTGEALAQFTLSAEVRPRAELRSGFKTVRAKAEDPAFFVEQRSRLYSFYQKDKVRLKLTMQDIRIWGNTSQIYKADPSLFNVYEAYGEYQVAPRVAVRVGRQELDYDNARFLGNLDWAQQGRSHDALKVMYADSSGISLHAGAGFNQSIAGEPTKLSDTYYAGVDNYKTMQFLWGHKTWEDAGLSVLFFNDGRQKADSTIAFRQTYGITGDLKSGLVKFGSEFYFQGGKDATGKPVRAFLAAANATLLTKIAPVTFGVDYLSGTGNGEAINRSFNPLYGTNHAFYGFMDYFYVGNPHGQEGRNTGLVDFYVKTNLKLGQNSSLLAHFHHFASPVAVTAPEESPGKLSSRLGEELDLVLNHNFSPDVNLKVGYSQLYATSSLEAIKGKNGSGLNQWAWAMLTFKPVLFKQSNP